MTLIVDYKKKKIHISLQEWTEINLYLSRKINIIIIVMTLRYCILLVKIVGTNLKILKINVYIIGYCSSRLG